MSNKIPCGGFYLDDMLNVNDSGELSIKGGTPYQQLVTDGDGNARWEDKMVVDSELSDTSTNPVQNKVIKSALDALRFDVPVYFNFVTGDVSCPVSFSEIVEKYLAGFYPVAILTGVYGDQSFIIGYSIGFVNKEAEFIFYFFDAISSRAKDGNRYPLAIQTVIISESSATISAADTTLISGLEVYGQVGFVMSSSTVGSSKKFRITVDDSGTISATEIT